LFRFRGDQFEVGPVVDSPAIMERDYFDPTPEEQIVVFVESGTLSRAEELIESYEHVNPEGAEIPN
jgi:hypothetical protein